MLGEYVPDNVGGDYDWIGFDLRGVGASEPSLSCDGELTTAYNRPYYVPVSPSGWPGPSSTPRRARGPAARCSTTSRPPTRSPTWRACARRWTPCVDGTIAAYLADGTLPARVRGNRSDKQCEPLPQPDPTAAAARSVSAPGGGASRLLEDTTVLR